MTIRVLKEGSLTRRVTCTRCQSELEYEPGDVKSTTYTDGDTISSIEYTITCPTCRLKLGPNSCFVNVRRPSDP